MCTRRSIGHQSRLLAETDCATPGYKSVALQSNCMATTDADIEHAVGTALRETNTTVAVAESATGGLLGSLLTNVSGSSDYFDRGVITYSYGAKRKLLGIAREHLDSHGAVSEPVAKQMARAVRDTAGTTWGVSTTGIAGPEGGSSESSVGTVYIGVAYAGPWGSNRSNATVERYEFSELDSRIERKEQFARQALEDLYERIEAEREETSD